MEYSKILDLASDLGHELAMCGAETFRVEESINLILRAYDIEPEVFVIPSCMHISIEPVIGRPLTRMHTGAIAVGILTVSTIVRMVTVQLRKRKST